MPLVSVLMPCYNAADTLPEALQSLSAQTWHDFEIIAVDDGSTDATPLVLRDWARKERRLRLLSQPHQGIIAALNAGLEQCQGQYIARMDADDRAHLLAALSEYKRCSSNLFPSCLPLPIQKSVRRSGRTH